MPLPRNPLKLVVVSAVVLGLGFGLTGCAPTVTGRSTAAAGHQIESVAGVERASVTSRTLLDGLTSSQTVGITVALSDGYRVGDADAAIVWLAREAWSVGHRRPGSMGVRVQDSSGKSIDWDWKAALVKRGWDSPLVDEDMNSGGQLILSASDMTSVAGKTWPGKAPSSPADVFVKN